MYRTHKFVNRRQKTDISQVERTLKEEGIKIKNGCVDTHAFMFNVKDFVSFLKRKGQDTIYKSTVKNQVVFTVKVPEGYGVELNLL
jgi:hypothetical protein